MTEEQTRPSKAIATLPVGGAVMAIVPQTFEEIQRVANSVIAAGVAPQALIKRVKEGAEADEIKLAQQQNIAAVATAIMAGAEVGLPPMAALRMFTVINGRPALYADGNVAVVRKAKDHDGKRVAEYIRAGTVLVYDFGCPYCDKVRKSEADVATHILKVHPDDDPTEPGRQILSDRTFGFCEAKRADTGEIFREEFTITDAKLAKLWDESPFKRAKVWRDGKQGWFDDVPNDAPWHRYWKRMLMWRPTGYCLRWLFADVLGGMPDEYEAREIASFDQMRDITPPPPPPKTSAQPPEPPPAEDLPDLQIDQDEPPSGADDGVATDVDELLAHIETSLDGCGDEEEVIAAWDQLDVEQRLAGDDDALARAFAIRNTAIDRVTPEELEQAHG